MDWKDLAPWIAIAITLSLSILVPLFTQIANNAHQMKMQKEKLDYERAQEKEKVYKAFLLNVGGAIAHATGEALIEAGASVYQIYLYAPTEWWEDLDALADAAMADVCTGGNPRPCTKELVLQVYKTAFGE